jgi:hypothetical protein
MIDQSKILYYTGNNTYKNLGVFPGTISVDTASVPPGGTRTWQTTVTVSPNSKFSTALIQANEPSGVTVSALRWQPFPPANIVYQTLSVDPLGDNWFGLSLDLVISGSQVTFRATAFNPNPNAYAFNPMSIGFSYAVHTTNI